MTAPTPPANLSNSSIFRALVSILETVSFIVATILYVVNNGQDGRNAVGAVMVGAAMHAVNHNAGGSPV